MSTISFNPLQRTPVTGLTAPVTDAMAEDRASFASVLGRWTEDGPGTDRTRPAAERFVAITLIQPVLKELRESNHAPPPFGPGPGEKPFRALLDAELAQRISRASSFPLVDRLAHDLRSRINVAGGDQTPGRS